MNLSYHHLLPTDFHDDARVWIYQSDRLFTMSEALNIEDLLEGFVKGWQSHGAPVKGFATLFFGQFIVFMADETATGVSGCSTDSSVRLVKQIEQRFKVNLFNRQLLAFVEKEKIQMLPLSQIDYAIKNGFIAPHTLYFNNTVPTRKEMINNWIVPVSQSWLKTRLAVHSAE